jgi:hypothetical protein
MMKYLILISMVVFPTVANAQYHSLSGEPVHDIPAFSWENPGWSEGSTSFNASHHNFPVSGSTSAGSGGGGSVPPSRLNNDFGNMD